MDSENIRQVFSENLNYWLKKRDKSQADLYKKMDVSSATASDWCNGKKIPRTDKLVEIAQWLMIELSDLLYDKPRVSDDIDSILYRLRDDPLFFQIVISIYRFDKDSVEKIEDYIRLIEKDRKG